MPSTPDRLFSVSVRLNGEETPEFLRCIQSLRVEEDIRQGSSFEVVVNACRNDDGSYPHIGDDGVEPWTRVTITAVVGTAPDVIMDGYITDVHVTTTDQSATLRAAFVGADASFSMNLEQRCKVWSGQTYEQIAEEIVTQRYGLQIRLPEDTPASSGEPPSVTQRSTDLRFLRELARRRGYEFYVLGGAAYFQPPNLTVEPQKLIAVNFGDQTNCTDLQISADFTQPTTAVVAGQDPETGESRAAEAADSGLTPLGSTDLASRRGYGVPPSRVVARRPPVRNEGELSEFARSIMRDRGFWLKAQGKLNSARYGAILRAAKPVTIKGVGRQYSGIFYVRRVVHTFSSRSYEMQFEAFRNRAGQSGSEAYEGEDPSATGIPALGGGAGGDSVTVRPDGAQVAPA